MKKVLLIAGMIFTANMSAAGFPAHFEDLLQARPSAAAIESATQFEEGANVENELVLVKRSDGSYSYGWAGITFSPYDRVVTSVNLFAKGQWLEKKVPPAELGRLTPSITSPGRMKWLKERSTRSGGSRSPSPRSR